MTVNEVAFTADDVARLGDLLRPYLPEGEPVTPEAVQAAWKAYDEDARERIGLCYHETPLRSLLVASV